jgi:aspartyl-tRNA(Asn)/glutamyl-tRNA(Gln) amidotransferase subunit B
MDNIDYTLWEGVIGLEVHAQLKTQSKQFCPDPYQYGSSPNTQVGPISLAHPGALPMPNKEAIKLAVKMGIACGSTIHHKTWFARKNYFYADLPKGYQITQFVTPICTLGEIKINTEIGGAKSITLDKIIIEEDSGKSIHDIDPFYSLIDLNRAGVPLIEIVSNPDIRHPEEANAYLTEIRKIVRYLDICDGNMEEGSLRCDANVSVRLKGTTGYNQRVEIKNLNSIRNVQRAITYEIKRQIEVYSAGGRITMDTMGFDAMKGTTHVLRSKEQANDYRYFPEPDIPPFVLTDQFIHDIKADMPDMPEVLKQRLIAEHGLSDYDAAVIVSERESVEFYYKATEFTKNYKSITNWINGPIRGFLNENALSFDQLTITPKSISDLINQIEAGTINFSVASTKVFPELTINPNESVGAIIERLNLSISNDDDQLLVWVKEAVAANPAKVAEYKSGKKGLIGMFMGDVMKRSNGKANPKTATDLLTKELEG